MSAQINVSEYERLEGYCLEFKVDVGWIPTMQAIDLTPEQWQEFQDLKKAAEQALSAVRQHLVDLVEIDDRV